MYCLYAYFYGIQFVSVFEDSNLTEILCHTFLITVWAQKRVKKPSALSKERML